MLITGIRLSKQQKVAQLLEVTEKMTPANPDRTLLLHNCLDIFGLFTSIRKDNYSASIREYAVCEQSSGGDREEVEELKGYDCKIAAEEEDGTPTFLLKFNQLS
ncbi:unnamed protein product [Cylicocyclus nassatus]|uniref:Uncharacterized protein n=1 Tax=Cylicocyclus nassatus TaxID=53992 RepID=A0AA36MA20_CYLNA|nr:unnamed protein product [Cylicocyclus nassatus]